MTKGLTARERLGEMVAVRDVHDVLVRYCRALDRADLARMETVYWPDGEDVHGIYVGRASEFVPFIISEITRYFTMCTHLVMNVDIKIDGDRAASESYLYSACRVRNGMAEEMLGSRYFGQLAATGLDADHETFVMAGRYLDRFERRDGEWRIKRRMVVSDWNACHPSNQILDEGMHKTLRPIGEWGSGDAAYANELALYGEKN